jgi:molybdopterin/thiamine biosynthesis adenylyltransferase/rhodanese-related sulfurtransferase
MELSKAELERYSRHLILPDFNLEGQLKLKNAKVLVVGTGGLGSPLLLYLTAAGVGKIGIVDFDIVDESNLQRQVLFNMADIGKPKVEAAKARLEALNPHVVFELFNTQLTSDNALDIISNYDVVADGTDNFPTRYLVNDACVLLGKPNVYASIYRFEGQVSVFNHTNKTGEIGPNYRDLFPSPPPPGLVPSCAEGGVIGVLPGILGSLQANEVIKVIAGIGDPLVGRLFLIDALSFETRTLKLQKRKDGVKIEQLIDYEQFCGLKLEEDLAKVKELSVQEFDSLQNSGEPYQLIDVREIFEHQIDKIDGGEHIPLGQISTAVEQFKTDRSVIFYCRVGERSAQAIRELEEKFGFTNLYNLKGGIRAWSKEIDESIAVV